jgi:hypothetical protein
MKISLALGKRDGLSRHTARGCVGTNLALPGFGSLMAGHAVGYAQALLTVAGFGLTMLFGVKFLVWALTHWSALYGPEADPLETMPGLWRQGRWAFLGMGLFALAWLWSLVTNAAILRSARSDDDTRKPPKLS